MSIDSIMPDGAPVTLTAPVISGYGSLNAAGFAAMGGSPDELVVAWMSNSGLIISTYTDAGDLIYNLPSESGVPYMTPPSLATVTQDGVAIALSYATNSASSGTHRDYLMIVHANGKNTAPPAILAQDGATMPATATTALDGVHLSWNQIQYNGSYTQTPVMQDWTQYTTPVSAPVAGYYPYADTGLAGFTFQIKDNQAQLLDGSGAVTLPGEPAHAVSQVLTAGLGNGEAPVAWIDSGSVYLAMYDSATHSISARTQLDFGDARELHLVTLPDGGFALSWHDNFNQNGTVYKGELFDSAGHGGGRLTLTGQFGAVDSHGDLYTVGVTSSGGELIQRYAISDGSSGGAGGSGQTFTSDNNGDHLTGTTGDDTFNLGRGGDIVTGNGGADVFKFAETPWAGGHITDFGATESVDLTGMLHRSGYTGSSPVADAYVTITADGSGSAQIWTDPHNGTGSWLVETLDGVAPNAVRMNGDVVVSTAASGSPTPPGQTYTSDNNGDHWTGTSGNDTFQLGRGGDTVTGGAGADTFAFAETPWAGAVITDFSHTDGDRIDVSGLLQHSGYTGSDPFADGYLRYTTDGAGNAQVWSDVHQTGNDGWWLVATLDGVSTSSLHYSGGLIT